MDIYLMYLRKSRADGEHETIEEVLAKHERMLQKTSVSLFGKAIPEKYIFREVVSGETIQDRPQIKLLLSAIESQEVKGVFVVDPQRLSRGDWEDGGKILSSFKYSNTLIITPPKTYNLHDEYDYNFFKMELSRGNDYLEYTKKILMRGRIASIESGNYIGSVAPYGYEKTFDDNRNPTLKPIKKEAEAINIAVKKRVHEGLGWSYIAKELEKMGYTPRKSKHWNPYTLRDICMNPVNIGKVVWNSRKTVTTYENGKLVKTRPRNKKDTLYKDGRHPAILDLDLYKKLVAKSGSITKETTNAPLVNPLASLLFCSTCGRAMTYRTYKRNGIERSSPRLLCDNQVHCKTKSATFSEVYNLLISSLEDIVRDFKFKMQQEDNSIYDMQISMIAELKAKLNDLDAREERLYTFVEDGTYSKEIFSKRMSVLEEERTEIEKQIEYLNENTIKPIDYEKKILDFQNVINALKDDNISAKYKNNLLKNIISRIDYYRNTENRTKYDTSKPSIKIHLKDF